MDAYDRGLNGEQRRSGDSASAYDRGVEQRRVDTEKKSADFQTAMRQQSWSPVAPDYPPHPVQGQQFAAARASESWLDQAKSAAVVGLFLGLGVALFWSKDHSVATYVGLGVGGAVVLACAAVVLNIFFYLLGLAFKVALWLVPIGGVMYWLDSTGTVDFRPVLVALARIL